MRTIYKFALRSTWKAEKQLKSVTYMLNIAGLDVLTFDCGVITKGRWLCFDGQSDGGFPQKSNAPATGSRPGRPNPLKAQQPHRGQAHVSSAST